MTAMVAVSGELRAAIVASLAGALVAACRRKNDGNDKSPAGWCADAGSETRVGAREHEHNSTPR
jgi:hypothetical protein